jgi:diaminopimelate decarboxylase
MAAAPAHAVVADALAAVAARHGTPAYVYDVAGLRGRVRALVATLPADVEVSYSVKANPTPALCREIATAGLGAEVSSDGELETALAAGFPPDRIMVSGPYKDERLLGRLAPLTGTLVSVDSCSELGQLAVRPEFTGRLMLRLRPDYPAAGEMAACAPARFGIPLDELIPATAVLAQTAGCTGFHVYGGSQILDPIDAADNLARSHDLATRAAARLGIHPARLSLGGGFGIRYDPTRCDLDLTPATATLRNLATRSPGTRLVLELGRYLAAPVGWYLTRVVHQQTFDGGPAVVVDGGIHQRPDLCGLDLAHRAAPPWLLGPPRPGGAMPTTVLGSLCLPWDVLAYGASLPPLRTGDVLAFPNAGAYGLTAAPTHFLSHPPPVEIILDDAALILPSQPPASPAGVT